MQSLGIEGWQDYRQRYREDPLLPSDPATIYDGDWQGWSHFLGKSQYSAKYRSFSEASQAVQALGITTRQEYEERYHEDPLLPSTPNKYYSEEWAEYHHPWLAFLGKPEPYQLYFEASRAALDLEITSRRDYIKRRHLDPKLPASPQSVYDDVWKGWNAFLKKGPNPELYRLYTVASRAAVNLGIKSKMDYFKWHYLDPKLPAHPELVYKDMWSGWKEFLKR